MGQCLVQTGTVPWTNGARPGTNWDPSLGQTGRFLLNSTVKSPFCRVCPWDRWGSCLGRLSRKCRQKNVYVFCCVYRLSFLPPNFQTRRNRVGLFYLRLGLFCLQLVFVAYGNLAWSFSYGCSVLMVENRFGLFYIRFPPGPEIGFGLFTYGSPTVTKKDEP